MTRLCDFGLEYEASGWKAGEDKTPVLEWKKRQREENEKMIEKVKMMWKLLTVKIGVVAVAVSFISLFLPWLTYRDISQSLMQALHADPDYFAGLLPAVVIAMFWIVFFFLTNHSKLTLLGDLVLLFVYGGMAIEGFDRGLSAGVGSYLYLLAVLVCIICAFLTRKQGRRRKKASGREG